MDMKSSESRWRTPFQYISLRHCQVVLLLFCRFGWVLGDPVPELRRVMLGHSVQLVCYPPSFVPSADFFIVQWKKQGSPSPVLLWRAGQANREGRGYEGRVFLLDKTTLSLVDLRSTDAGLYECQMWDVNGHQIGNSTSTEVEVISAIPKFVSQPNSVMMVPGGLAEFNCSVDPLAETVRWQHNGKWLNSSSTTTVSNGHIKVKISQDRQIQWQQQGSYQCIAIWENAALSSVSADLKIIGILQLEEQESFTASALLGGYALISGFLPHSVPTAIPSVKHNGSLLPTTSPRVMLLPSGNLHIHGVLASDAGIYQFSATNPVTNETVIARSVKLQVTRPERPLPPQLLAAPKDVSVKVGNSVTFECAVSGNPQPIILWTKYGGVLPVGRYQQVLGNLILYDLHSNDSGTYICEAGNTAGHPVSAVATLNVYETPEIDHWTNEYEIPDQEELVLACHTKGLVHPVISWHYNGTQVIESENLILKDSKLVIKAVERSTAGFYQCFASVDTESATAVTRVRVIPRSAHDDTLVGDGSRKDPTVHLLDRGWERSKNSTLNALDDSSDPPEKEIPKDRGKTKNRRKKKKHKHGSGGGDSKVLMIPPTRPEVTKLSDESVMVRWDVPVNSGLPILFFKVQYKDLTKSLSSWMTIDEDIAPHILSYEVMNLHTGHVYRFRIAAVYSNNDNKLGPNSNKFILQKDSPTKKPVVGPTIIHAEAISPSAIMITWQYLDIEEVPIEGFFIYYRSTTSAGAYSKVTVLGANTSSHIISYLLPDIAYDIKMQCFNNAGTSDFSNIRTEKTFASPHSLHEGTNENIKGVNELPQTSDTATSDQLLYTILGSVLGSLTVLLIVFVSYCSWKQRQRNRTQRIRSAHSKDNCGSVLDKGKFLAVNGSPANGHVVNMNGVLLWNKVRSGDQQVTETSLTESPDTLLNNNYSEMLQDGHTGERDVDVESAQSDSEDNPSDQILTACKPLIHHEEEGYSSDENFVELQYSSTAQSDNFTDQMNNIEAAGVSPS